MDLKASALLLLAVSTAALAQAPSKPAREVAKYKLSQGPVTITADRAEFDQSGVMLYRGRVKLVSEQITLTGDRLELRQPAEGQYEARVTGNPANLTHAGDATTPPVSARAGEITYSSQAGVIDLRKDVQLDRSGDVLNGDAMKYDIAARRISAVGADGGQVRIVIKPPEGKKPVLPPQVQPRGKNEG
jgi:lipopolysaccharide transport protein LptA